MSQAICTKYLQQTCVHGPRVMAWCQAGEIIVDWDDNLDQDGNHDAAATMLLQKFGWAGTWVGGGLPNGNGNAYVKAKLTPRKGKAVYR